jgi:hypothetical protein
MVDDISHEGLRTLLRDALWQPSPRPDVTLDG